jgi:hypothetical protein
LAFAQFLEGINSSNLEITNLIDLSASMLNANSSNEEEDDEVSAEVSINHGNPDFDILDEMLVNKFSINID